MILHLSDWKKYPTAFPDFQTSNKSFINISAKLKKMGVENHTFMLVLLDRKLVGVDPNDENLSFEMKKRIARETKLNRWYIFRELTYFPPAGGGPKVKFEANLGSIAMIWLFYNHITILVLQPRQTGKTVVAFAIWCAELGLVSKDVLINLITSGEKLREESVSKMKKILKYYPSFLRFTTKKDIDNKVAISMLALKNRLQVHVGQSDKDRANMIGRGLTSPMAQSDEPAFTKNIEITLPAALAAGTASRNEAKQYGLPYGTILTTTAGNPLTPSGAYLFKKYNEALRFLVSMYDIGSQKILSDLLDKSTPGIASIMLVEYNHLQLGKDDEWLNDTLRDTGSEGPDARRDFFLEWVSNADSKIFSSEKVRIMSASEREPVDNLIINGYTFNLYVDKNLSNLPMLISMDTSDAMGSDAIYIILTDVSTGDVVATAGFNLANIDNIAKVVASILIDYKYTTMIFESKSSGYSMFDIITNQLFKHNINPFKRIYNNLVDDATSLTDDKLNEVLNASIYELPQLTEVYKKKFGFSTSGSGKASRSKLYSDTLMSAIKVRGDKMHDKTLIGQTVNLTNINGRVDHPIGGNDDSVIAWLLGHWFLKKGRNLECYGININKIYNRTNIKSETISPMQNKLMNVREKILLDITKSSGMKKKIMENRLLEINNRLKGYSDTTLEIVSSRLQVENTNNTKLQTSIKIDNIVDTLMLSL